MIMSENDIVSYAENKYYILLKLKFEFPLVLEPFYLYI